MPSGKMNDEFMEFMGYRNMVLEEKIAQCLEAARQGMTSVTIDCDDLTEEEVEYLQQEVQRRLQNL